MNVMLGEDSGHDKEVWKDGLVPDEPKTILVEKVLSSFGLRVALTVRVHMNPFGI